MDTRSAGMTELATGALKLAGFMTRKGWSGAFQDQGRITQSGENVTLMTMQQGRHRPMLTDFGVRLFDPAAYEENEEAAEERFRTAFTDLTEFWEVVHELSKKANTEARPAQLAQELRTALKEVDDTQVTPYAGASDKRTIYEFYRECERLLEMDMKLDMSREENVNELHTFVKKKMQPGKLRDAFTRKWNTWHARQKLAGVENPWPAKKEIISWIDQSVLSHKTPQDLYQTYLHTTQRHAGLAAYNSYKIEFESLQERCKEAGISLTQEGCHRAAIFQFILGIHSTTRRKLGDICKPDWADNKTIEEAIEKITTRLLLKSRQDTSETAEETVAHTQEVWDGETWDTTNHYDWYEDSSQEWPEETVAYNSTWDSEEHTEEDMSWYQDYKAADETVAYGYGYQSGHKGGNKGGYKGSSYKGSGYKGGKGKGKGFHPYTSYGNRGAKGGKGKGYKGGSYKGGSFKGGKGKGEVKRCPRCKSVTHSDTEKCWYSTDYNSSKFGERPAHVDPKDEELLKRVQEKNAERF